MIDGSDIEAAATRLHDAIRRTPMLTSTTFSDMAGAEVVLKCELLQRTGSFKIRGATNRIATLDADERARGVVTASGGNHAQGVALAATLEGIDATIVMPEGTSTAKVEATRAYGGDVVLHGADYNESAALAHELERDEGRVYVHAFEDEAVIAGQGTVGLEIVEDRPDTDTVVVPIGGGGLISGIAVAVAHSAVDARVVGVQSAGATSAERSVAAGRVVELDAVDTIAEGMATRRIGETTLAHISAHVDELVTVTDDELITAIGYLLERSKLLAEPAGAAGVAAIIAGAIEVEPDEVVVPVVSGGNLDLRDLPGILERFESN